jgi:hypothetical protein
VLIGKHAQQIFGILGLLPVLEIVEIGDKFRVIEDLLLGCQVVDVVRIGQALDELSEWVNDNFLRRRR